MRNIWTVMSKEFARFFTDKRMIVMTILPAILIYASYSLMGTAMQTVFAPDADHTRYVHAVNMPDSIASILTSIDVGIANVSENDIGIVKERIENRQVDLLAIFPPHFDEMIENFDTQSASAVVPNVVLHFNSIEPNSHAAYMGMRSVLDDFKTSIVNIFDINRDIVDADLASAEDLAATVIASLMPMLLMIFLYSGCMALALESITGEKERGTLATLLVTPLRRSELAVGKILSLATLSFISGAVTTVATIFAIPNLMAGGGDIDANIYSAVDYVLLSFVIITTLLLMVTMISIISAFAKTVKEAGTAVTPLMFIIMLVGISGMFGGVPDNPLLYAIPLYGSVQSMSGIFSLNYSITNILISGFSTLIYACIGGFVLAKLFNSEKVMFSK